MLGCRGEENRGFEVYVFCALLLSFSRMRISVLGLMEIGNFSFLLISFLYSLCNRIEFVSKYFGDEMHMILRLFSCLHSCIII